MKPFATYITRVSKERIHQIKDHWEHHRPLCLNGMVCLNSEDYTDENIALVKSFGLRVCCGLENEDFDKNLKIAANASVDLEGNWFLTIDSDEYLPPFHFKDVALSAYEAEASGQQWLRAWMCDRLSEGGLVKGPPIDYRYSTLNESYPVMTDVTKFIQGSCNVKCFLSLKPDIGLIHYKHGECHPKWFRLDHYKWFGDVIEKTEERSRKMWTSQYKRTVQHFKKEGRIAGETCLATMWESRHGWFNFWELYKRIIDSLPKNGPVTIVEVGVWQGKSATFLAQYALAVGVDFQLYLVDKFRGCEATAIHLPKVDPHLSTKSNFIHKVTQHFHENGIADRSSFIQLESWQAAKCFEDGSIDFIFIDDDHSYDAVKLGLESWIGKVKKGSIISGHDYDHPEVSKAVDEFFTKGKVQCVGNSWMVVA
jgi:hypothetical protein